MGQALHTLFAAGEVRREEVVIMTKVGTIQREVMDLARTREVPAPLAPPMRPMALGPPGQGGCGYAAWQG